MTIRLALSRQVWFAAFGIALNAGLQWAARRGAPWLSERELTV